MTDREALIHDLSVIGHLSERIDLRDKEQIRAVLLLQKNDQLFKTEYGKRFIARLIAYFTGREAPDTCIFTGKKLFGLFPVSEDVLAMIDRSPEEAADTIIGKQKTNSAYILDELRYRQREEAAEEANKKAIKEQEELRKAQKALEKEEAPYKAVRKKAKQASDAANIATDRLHEFSGAEEGESNSVFNLFRDIEKPWKYAKVYWWLFIVFLLCGYWFIMTRGAGAVPFEMALGAGLAPAAVILFLNELSGIYETEVSFKNTALLCGFGALLSMLVTWATKGIFEDVNSIHVFLKSLVEGAVSVLALLAVVLYHIKKTGKNVTMLQGIFYGSCFGSGFAFYEVCDMALSGYFSDQRSGVFMWHLITQSVMAVGGRIAWTAVIGGAFSVIIKKAGVIKSQEFVKMCLLAFIYPFVMQVCWEAGFLNVGLYGVTIKDIFLIVVAFMVLNLFLHRGIREAGKVKADV